MYRGTTPTFTLQLNSDLDLTSMEQIWVTFKNKSAEVTYEKDDVTIDAENCTITVHMTQEDSLKFQTCGVLQGKIELQVRLLDNQGVASASNIAEVDLLRILKEGVIEAQEEVVNNG